MGDAAGRIVELAKAIRSDRYAKAAAVFAAGSIVRGEGTAHSDLDLVVVYPRLQRAYRESFTCDGYPVEAFVHDHETLEYFFEEIDRPSGVPALAQMLVEGVDIPAATDLSRALKAQAASAIAAGPPPLDAQSERLRRYTVTDLLDDLRDPRSHDEAIAVGARLYDQLADYHLRRQGLWSARGKSIPRTLRRTDAALCARYCRSFERLFTSGDAADVIALAEEILRPGRRPAVRRLQGGRAAGVEDPGPNSAVAPAGTALVRHPPAGAGVIAGMALPHYGTARCTARTGLSRGNAQSTSMFQRSCDMCPDVYRQFRRR